jgi:hypothetical protein
MREDVRNLRCEKHPRVVLMYEVRLVQEWYECHKPPKVQLLHIYQILINFHYSQSKIVVKIVILRHCDTLKKQKYYKLVEYWLGKALLNEFEF